MEVTPMYLNAIKRWAPLAGGSLLVLAGAARLMGHATEAQWLEDFVANMGVPTGDVTPVEIASLAALGFGLVRKFTSMWKASQAK